MALLEEIRSEREALEAEVRGHAARLMSQAKTAIEMGRELTPVAVAVVGTDTRIYKLYWQTPKERMKVLRDFNQKLSDDNATATILTTMRPFRGSESAVVMTVQTPAWREMRIVPFKILPNGIIAWGQDSVRRDFTSALKSACLN